ncbi:MAG: YicC/YloC family endoribonuclease, partial [Desulfomonilia bacterium]
MPRSMTGFGQADKDGYHIEIKGVNHRYRDIRVRVPKDLSSFEIPARDLVHERVTRGKVEVNITRSMSIDVQERLAVNWDLARIYSEDLGRMAREFGGEVTFRDILMLPGILGENARDIEELWPPLREGMIEALASFTAAKAEEGGRLKADISKRLESLVRMHQDMKQAAQGMVDIFRERLLSRLQELLGDKADKVDETRVEQEIALMADRSDITEELVRLHSHIASFQGVIDTPDPSIGRRLDFMLQEINRELNTIGSKSQVITLSHIVIEAKAEVEKIREQVQNI